jgi:hypothetical protein
MTTGLFVLRAVVGFAFLGAAVAKGQDLSALGRTLRALGLSRTVSRRLSPIVVCAELTIGVYLLVPSRSGYLEAVAICFAGALVGVSAYAIATGRTVPCSCFGASSRPLGLESLLVAAALTGAIVASGFGEDLGGLTAINLGLCWTLALVLLALALWLSAVPRLIRILRQRRQMRGKFVQVPQ